MNEKIKQLEQEREMYKQEVSELADKLMRTKSKERQKKALQNLQLAKLSLEKIEDMIADYEC